MGLCVERLESEILRSGKTKEQISREVGFDIGDIIKTKTATLSLITSISECLQSNVNYLIGMDKLNNSSSKNKIHADFDTTILKERIKQFGWSVDKLSMLVSSRNRFLNAIIYSKNIKFIEYYESINLCHYLQCSLDYLRGNSNETGEYPEHPINHSLRMNIIDSNALCDIMHKKGFTPDSLAAAIKFGASYVRDIVDGKDILIPDSHIKYIANKLKCNISDIIKDGGINIVKNNNGLSTAGAAIKAESKKLNIKLEDSIDKPYNYKNSGPRKLDRAEKMLNLAIDDPECFAAICKLIDASDECRKTATKCINAITDSIK